jgi:hypothetical protein
MLKFKKMVPVALATLCLVACGGGGSGGSGSGAVSPAEDSAKASGLDQATVDAYVACVGVLYTGANKKLDETLRANDLFRFDDHEQNLLECCEDVAAGLNKTAKLSDSFTAAMQGNEAPTGQDGGNQFRTDLRDSFTVDMKLSAAIESVVTITLTKKHCEVS